MINTGLTQNPDRTAYIGIDASPLLKGASKERTYLKILLKYLSVTDKTDQFYLMDLGFNLFYKKLIDFKAHNFKCLNPISPAPKLDIVHLNDLKTDAINKRQKYIITFHDLSEAAFPDIFEQKHAVDLRNNISKAISNSKAVIVPSISAKTLLLKEFRAEARKINIIRFAAGDGFIPETRYRVGIAKTRYSIKGDYIFCLLSDDENKNPVRLLEAYSHLKYESPPALVIGGQIRNIKSQLLQTAKKLDIVNNVCLAGHIQQKDLPSIYSGAEAFLSLGIYEGASFSVLEAMSCAVPIIASNLPSSVETAGNAAVYCEAASAEAIAASLRKVLFDERLKQDMRQKSFERAKLFTAKNMALETLKLYKEAAFS